MAWLIMALRRNELQASLNDHHYEQQKLKAELDDLSVFATAIGDGTITPNEIADMGADLFGDALDFNEYANISASNIAQEQTDFYASTYGNITQEQYYNNSGIASQAQLYFDESGQLNTVAMYGEFYDEALQEFAQKYFMPYLKEKEKEIQTKQAELEALIASEEAELDSLKGSISNQIQQNAINIK